MVKILEIGPGIIPIPPHSFGAIERVIWELYLALTDQGDSVIIYNKVHLNPKHLPKDRLIHCHWAGHALTLQKNNIPYAFTSHSHMWRQTDYRAIMGSKVYLSLHEQMVPDEYKGHVHIVGNGVNTDFWHILDNTERQLVVVACANCSERKRLSWMFDLIDLLPSEWRGLIVGPNVPVSLGSRSHKRVTLLGEQSTNQLVKIYNEAMVGFHPAKEEAFALVPMEMAACGLATFVSHECYVYGPGIYSFNTLEQVAEAISEYIDLTREAHEVRQSVSELYHTSVKLNHSWHTVAKRVKKGLSYLND